MGPTVVLLAFLAAGSSGRLHSGDAQDLASYNNPGPSSGPPPSGSSVGPGGIIGSPYNNIFPEEEITETSVNYRTQGNLRKSFSYIPIKKSKAKPRYEALKSNLDETDDRSVTENYPKSFLQERTKGRGRAYFTSTERSQQEIEKNTPSKIISGPNVDGQQPYRHWSTESNVIREEHPEGLSSYPYIRPTQSTPETEYARRNLKDVYESSTVGYDFPKQPYDGNSEINRHAIIPPTTYRPVTKRREGYTFSFSSKNHSRQETGDTKGNFRGSVKYIDTFGRNKQIDYAGNPDVGIVTTENTPIVNIPGNSGQIYLSPSTSRPTVTNRNGLRYSFSSPPTSLSYNPGIGSTTATPPSAYRIGKTVYQPPQYYVQPDQTYMTGNPNIYYTEMPQYVMLSPDYGSYMFRYDAGDHQRRESRDGSGNVQGMYSFEGTDGERKEVTYEANAEKGFVARGSHLPMQPDELTRSQETYQQSTISPESETTSNSGTYYFAYNAGEHMREERKDADGNIHGVYSYITGDGQRKTVRYRASPSEGFVATGDDIPHLPDGSYSMRYDAGEQDRQLSDYKSQISYRQ